jgi:hypothetical protein
MDAWKCAHLFSCLLVCGTAEWGGYCRSLGPVLPTHKHTYYRGDSTLFKNSRHGSITWTVRHKESGQRWKGSDALETQEGRDGKITARNKKRGKDKGNTVAENKGFTHPVTEQPAFDFPTHDRLHLPSSGVQLMCVCGVGWVT